MSLDAIRDSESRWELGNTENEATWTGDILDKSSTNMLLKQGTYLSPWVKTIAFEVNSVNSGWLNVLYCVLSSIYEIVWVTIFHLIPLSIWKGPSPW